MPKPRLQAELSTLEGDIVETLLAGLKQWRRDLSYPESHSDMQGCVRALLMMYEVKRRPIALLSLPLHCGICGGAGHTMALVDGEVDVFKRVSCPECGGKRLGS